jgi:cell division protein FtsB
MNLDDIVKKLELAGIDITVGDLKEHLSKKGLDASTYERGETTLFNELESIFASMLTKINDIVVYNRSVFGFEKVDRIFLSMQNGRLKGAREFIENFGMSGIEVLDFNVFRNKEEGNFFEKIVTSYIYDKYELKDFRHNLTIFEREPAFYKKESGKVLLIASFIVLLSLGYVGLVKFENINLQTQHDALKEQYDMMKKTQSQYKRKIATVNKEIKDVQDKKLAMDNRVENITKSMTQLENLIDAKKGYSSFVYKVNNLLKKYKLSTTKMTIIGQDSMSVEIIAEYQKRDNITKFMEDLITSGFIGIATDEIKSDKDVYISKIEIKK